MGMQNFGMLNFTIDSKAADFVKFLEQGKVMTTRCKKCGTVFSAPQMDCPTCLLSEIEWVEIKDVGKLVTYTVVEYGPTGFENDARYALAVVKFKDCQFFGRLDKNIKKEEIKIGMTLKVLPVKLSSERISYMFVSA
jgi:uncharacterized OB-fold protein